MFGSRDTVDKVGSGNVNGFGNANKNVKQQIDLTSFKLFRHPHESGELNLRITNMFSFLSRHGGVSDIPFMNQLKYDLSQLKDDEKNLYLKLVIKLSDINQWENAKITFQKELTPTQSSHVVVNSECANEKFDLFFDEINNTLDCYKNLDPYSQINVRVINMFLLINKLKNEPSLSLEEQIKGDLLKLENTVEKYLYLRLALKLCEANNFEQTKRFFLDKLDLLRDELHASSSAILAIDFNPKLNQIYNDIYTYTHQDNQQPASNEISLAERLRQRFFEESTKNNNQQISHGVYPSYSCDYTSLSFSSASPFFSHYKGISSVVSDETTTTTTTTSATTSLSSLGNGTNNFNLELRERSWPVANGLLSRKSGSMNDQQILQVNDLVNDMVLVIIEMAKGINEDCIIIDNKLQSHMNILKYNRSKCLYLALMLKICDDNKWDNIRNIFELKLDQVSGSRLETEPSAKELWGDEGFNLQYNEIYDKISSRNNEYSNIDNESVGLNQRKRSSATQDGECLAVLSSEDFSTQSSCLTPGWQVVLTSDFYLPQDRYPNTDSSTSNKRARRDFSSRN
ncbi:MAG: hypothetical protein QG673_482, partial [Pseudomonadota bacterium]|nr:hypothetical protein [Pseudomonadota bacterium]